jgi:hypothetical protein
VTRHELENAGESDLRLFGFLCKSAELRSVVDRDQFWAIGQHRLVVRWELNERYRYRLRVVAGWPLELTRRRSLMPAEVFAITVEQRLIDWRDQRPSLARFKARLLIEAGIVEPPTVEMPPLPNDAPESAVLTWSVIRRLLEARHLVGDDTEPFPFVAPRMASWYGIDEATIRAGKLFLQRRGFLVHVTNGPVGAYGKPMHLFDIGFPATLDADDSSDTDQQALLARLMAAFDASDLEEANR